MDKNKVLLPNEIFDLAVKNHQKNKLKISENLYNKVLEINPNDTSVNYNLGKLYTEIKEYQKAISCYEKTIKINPNYINAYYNLGLLFKLLGKFQKAIECFEKVIEIDPNNVQAYNNCAVLLGDTVDLIKAKKYLKKAISIDPKNLDLYWNLHGQASNIDEALEPLEELNKINNNYPKAKIMISALNVYKGNFDLYKDLLSTANSNHAHTRSIKWVFSLPNLPKIFFNRLEFFDAIIPLTEISRPFYEFGVWNGESFKYLINSYKKGFGFDTFDMSLRAGVEIYHVLKKRLKEKKLGTNVGDEGGFAPNFKSSIEILDEIMLSISEAGYLPEKNVSLALDVASSEFFENSYYNIEGEKLTNIEMADYLVNLTNNYPILSIEDGLAEDDWEGWKYLTDKLGDKIQLVGDDLFVTQEKIFDTYLSFLPSPYNNQVFLPFHMNLVFLLYFCKDTNTLFYLFLDLFYETKIHLC